MNDSFSGEVHGVLFFSCIAWVFFFFFFNLVASDGYFSLSVVRICIDSVSYNVRYSVLLNKKEKIKGHLVNPSCPYSYVLYYALISFLGIACGEVHLHVSAHSSSPINNRALLLTILYSISKPLTRGTRWQQDQQLSHSLQNPGINSPAGP